MTIALEVGDIERFADAGQFASYCRWVGSQSKPGSVPGGSRSSLKNLMTARAVVILPCEGRFVDEFSIGPVSFVEFTRGRGRDKVLWATDYPLLTFERTLAELEALDLGGEVLRKVVRHNAIRALASTKRAIWRSLDRGIDVEFDYEVFAQVRCLQSQDHREALAAFREKRRSSGGS
jgi:hypothetical protein